MRDGIIESALDARWIERAGRLPYQLVDVFVDGLTPVALWYAFETARTPAWAADILVDTEGYLVIPLNDDANPPGWYHYRKRAAISDDVARQLVREQCGHVVQVPLAAMLSAREVGRW